MSHLDETSPALPDVELESVIEGVLKTVAAYENVPTTELPPLFEVVDPDALAAIFASPPGGPIRSEGSVTFPYASYQITVSADGSITAEPLDGLSSPD